MNLEVEYIHQFRKIETSRSGWCILFDVSV